MLRLATQEQKSSIYTIQFGSGDVVRTVEAVGQHLASNAGRYLNKTSISTHSGMLWTRRGHFGETPAVLTAGVLQPACLLSRRSWVNCMTRLRATLGNLTSVILGNSAPCSCRKS
jgi:hypothetical protein